MNETSKFKKDEHIIITDDPNVLIKFGIALTYNFVGKDSYIKEVIYDGGYLYKLSIDGGLRTFPECALKRGDGSV